ncbi:MAG: hypothetical protein P8R42_23780 [Candidatus Binatia bacterium]|nr:hypothetical protein [Candidatus Binatia bacterium]
MAPIAIAFGVLELTGPALMGIVPQVIEEDRLQSANALLGMAQSTAWGLGGGAVVDLPWVLRVRCLRTGVQRLVHED